MRTSWIAAAALLGALAHADAHAQTAAQAQALEAGRPLIGTPAPRLELTSIDGEAIDLGELYGKKAVYLKFWATWCIPCRQQMPHFEHVYQTAGADLAVVAINVGMNDPLEDVRKFRDEYGIADMATFPWAHGIEKQGHDPARYPNVVAWWERVRQRPAVRRGVKVLSESRRLKMNAAEREVLFGATQHAGPA